MNEPMSDDETIEPIEVDVAVSMVEHSMKNLDVAFFDLVSERKPVSGLVNAS